MRVVPLSRNRGRIEAEIENAVIRGEKQNCSPAEFASD